MSDFDKDRQSHWCTCEDCDLDAFREEVEHATQPEDYPFACEVQQNVSRNRRYSRQTHPGRTALRTGACAAGRAGHCGFSSRIPQARGRQRHSVFQHDDL